MDRACRGATASSGTAIQVCFPDVQGALLEKLNQQREDGMLCDLSIHVQGQVFKAHRCVLAASSPYFHDQVVIHFFNNNSDVGLGLLRNFEVNGKLSLINQTWSFKLLDTSYS